MSDTIKKYTAEFKQDAINYVESHPEIPVRVAARNLDIPESTLHGWVRAYQRSLRAGDSEPVKGKLTDDEKEIIRLRRELRDTQDALEILKKAISILGD